MTDPFPDSLASSVSFLRAYLDNPVDQPFLVFEHPGSRAREFISRILEARGFHPIILYENEEPPAFDIEERRIFPVFDLPKPIIPPANPSILLVPPNFPRKDEFAKCPFAVFTTPTLPEREDFLRGLGAPVVLADGNPGYDDLLHAALAWKVSGEEVRVGPTESVSWRSFKEGGEPPIPEGLLPYYAAYAFPPHETWPNRNLGQVRRAPAFVGRLLLDQLRVEWPDRPVPFPTILQEPKARAASSPSSGERVASGEKAYRIEWD